MMQPTFGDRDTADVILTLVPLEGPDGPPLYLHSQALRKSQFFEARLSERWSLGNSSAPVELTLNGCRNVYNYIKCIEMMYSSERFKFSSVEEALAILEIASEFIYTDCLNSCLKYLEAVPWTAENEHQIRASLTSLQLQLHPDLAVRLSTAGCDPNFEPVIIMEETLSELLSQVSKGEDQKVREVTERALRDNNISPAFADVNKSVLFKELQKNLEFVKSQIRLPVSCRSSLRIKMAISALSWLVDEIFALQIADMAVKMFAEEQELSQMMMDQRLESFLARTFFSILDRLLEALQKGEVISSRSVRLSMVKTWLPVMAKLEHLVTDNEVHNNLEQGLRALVATLPITDQQQVFKIWISCCFKSGRAWPDLSGAFDLWCNKLRLAQNGEELPLSSSET